MQSFESYVSLHLPWLWGLLAWTLAVIAILALFAVPAFFILYPIATNVRRALRTSLTGLFALQDRSREGRRRTIDALVEEFRSNSGLSVLTAASTTLEAAIASFGLNA